MQALAYILNGQKKKQTGKNWSLKQWFALFNCSCCFNSHVFCCSLVQISDQSAKISASGVELAGVTLKKLSIGFFF